MNSEADKMLEFTKYYKHHYEMSMPDEINVLAFLQKIKLPSLSDQLLEKMIIIYLI